MKKRVAIIGVGLQARRRLPAILEDSQAELIWVVSRTLKKTESFARNTGARVASDWRKITRDKNVDIVLVLTPPDTHASISIDAMNNGKDVLCEKPLAQKEKEAWLMVETAKKTGKILKCGFNHRHHPAIREAYRLFKNNLIGKPLFVRSRYGIAGREGIKREWRSDTKVVGGGQLMEQGIHLVDLVRWFIGDIYKATGFVSTNFWPIKPLEDNGFALFQNKDMVTASIHSSLTQWINLFEFEIYGEKGSLSVNGLGGSYGTEKLLISLHEPEKPFTTKIIEYRGPDVSWTGEWQEFINSVKTRKQPLGNAEDGYMAMRLVNAVYESSKSGKTVELTKK